MNVLIIDDSDYKINQLSELLAEVLPNAAVTIARAFQTGLRKALDTDPDLLLLDISLPTFEVGSGEPGGRTRAFGGREILRELANAGRHSRAIVVTQFDRFGEGPHCVLREDLMRQLETEFGPMVVAGVYYSGATSEWREVLRKRLIEFRT